MKVNYTCNAGVGGTGVDATSLGLLDFNGVVELLSFLKPFKASVERFFFNC